MNRLKRCQPLLGTFVEISVEDARSEEALDREIDRAFQEIAEVGRIMSFHDPESELSRLNQSGHREPVRVHPWMHEVIDLALWLSERSEGAFDVTVAPQLVKWGFLPKHAGVSRETDAASWRDIDLSDEGHIGFRRPLQIDLGGIAKGFAVDKAIEHLESCGIESAVVNAGGDMRVHGANPEEVMIRDPRAPHSRTISSEMYRAAVATSASYFAKRRHWFSRVNHLVHPETGRPLRSRHSVSVFSGSALVADALTKVVLLAPQEIWIELLRETGSLALLINRKGEQILLPS